MKNDYVYYSDYSAYLTQQLGRKPSMSELISFESNQNLMLINKRSSKNDAFYISFTNGTEKQLITEGIVKGGMIQMHSQEAGHRFYSVMFEQQDLVEEHYLILDASIESVELGQSITTLVQCVRLITIEDLVQQYNPITYNLN